MPADKCGVDLMRPMVGRGSAYGDLDGDGDLDLLFTSSGRAAIAAERPASRAPLDPFLAPGTQCNRDAIGAGWVVHGRRVLARPVMPTRSYLSQSELAVTVGLGTAAQVDKVVIHWPGGNTQTLEQPAIDQLHVVRSRL